MPRASIRQRELKRQQIYKHTKKTREYLLQARRKVTNSTQQLELAISLENLPKDSSACRQSNRCSATHTAQAYNRQTGLSRYQLRELGLKIAVPGLFKASW